MEPHLPISKHPNPKILKINTKMVSKKIIKDLAEKEKKKIGNSTIKKIEGILTEKTKEILKDASRQADFSGRKIIKPQDIHS